MTSSAKADWLIPAGLIALSFISIAFGPFLYAIRLLAGSAIALFLCFGFFLEGLSCTTFRCTPY
jgi:hypothetical protein